MYFHLTDGEQKVCKSDEIGVLTENLNIVDCPECCKVIRTASIKLHSRRRKNMDMVIIRKVLLDNHSRLNTSPEDWESMQERLYELEEEVKEFNPSSPTECLVMSLVAEAMEEENARN